MASFYFFLLEHGENLEKKTPHTIKGSHAYKWNWAHKNVK
jgi:hypothetical protein